ncbi:MAG: PAS domain S-box protein [Pyrinomonadaceae bacterium]
MLKLLRVLHVEDSERDVLALKRHLSRAGYEVVAERVDRPSGMSAALQTKEWDLILCDYTMPQFDALSALNLLQETGLDIPFIIISGTIGEEMAVEAMLAGAQDCLMKDNLAQLAPAIEREIHEAKNRHARRRMEEALLQQKTELRVLFDLMPAMIWFKDTENGILRVNQHVADSIGITVEEIEGKLSAEIYPQMADKYYADDLEVIRSGKPKLGIVEKLQDKDGNELWVQTDKVPYSNQDGKVIGIVVAARDITERMLAEEALKASEAKQRQLLERNSAILDALPAHICLLDAVGNILEVNATWKHFAVENNYSGNTFAIGTNYLEVCESACGEFVEGAKQAADGIRAVLSGKLSNFELEYPCHSPDEKRWFRLMIAPLKDDPFEGLVVMHLNITERKTAEGALIKLTGDLEVAVQEYRQVIDHSLDVICQVDEAGRFIQVSAAAKNVWGYEPEELIGRMYMKLVHPDDHAKTAQAAIDIMAGQATSTFENCYLRKDGSIAHLMWSAIWSASDKTMFCVARDISKLKQAEAALKESEANYQSLVESSPAIVYLAQAYPPYSPIYVSPNIVAFGYTTDEWFSRPDMWINLVHDEDRERVLHATQEAMNEGLDTELEYRIVARDGQIHWVQDKGRFITDRRGNKTGWQGVILDITKTKALETQLRQSQKLESVGLLAGGIAHDFNNMLTAINGYSDLTLMRLKNDDPLRRNIEEIKKAGERSASLTYQLLAFSRQQILQPKVLSLNRVIIDTSRMLERLIGEDIQLFTSLNQKAGQVEVDPGQLSQIIMNLAVNARDAMPHGGKLTFETDNVTLDENYARHHVSTIPGEYVMMSVSDTGTGMNAETKTHLFEPFFTTEVGKGTGLGLATVYGIVKQSGGYIWVYGEEGIGTTFKVYFPRVIEQPEAEAIENTSKELPKGSETILLVEDEDMVRTLAHHILEICGYTVLEARNGVEALSLCEKQDCHVDLLVTDVVMPLMGGRELAERFAQIYPQMCILFTSGYTDDAIVRHGVIEAGVKFIQKPFTPDALARKVRELLDKI